MIFWRRLTDKQRKLARLERRHFRTMDNRIGEAIHGALHFSFSFDEHGKT